MNKIVQFYNKWREYIRVDALMYLTMILGLAILFAFFW
jgi:preprotein translocase subunit SecY